MSSLFAQKDAKAVARGRQSVKAKKGKDTNASASADKNTTPNTPISTEDIPVVHGNQLVLVNKVTGVKTCYRKPEVETIEGMLGKTMSLDDFLERTRNSSEALNPRIFNSDLTTAELTALDLKANVKLFPEIVNSEGALRQRPLVNRERERTDGRFAKKQKLNNGNVRNIVSHPEALSKDKLIERLSSQKQWFADIESAAGRQVKAYEEAISELRKAGKGDQDQEPEFSTASLPTSGLEALLSEALPKPHSLTLDDWKKRESALLSHVHSIAERYRRELSGLAVYVNRSLKAFEQEKTSIATLLSGLAEREIPAIDIEAWVLEMNAGEDNLRCQCQAADENPASASSADADDLTSALEHLWNEKEKSDLDITKARQTLEESHEDWDWSNQDAPEEPNRRTAETEWIEKWDEWYRGHVKKIGEELLNRQQELLRKRSDIEWEIFNRKMELTNKTDDVQRLKEYMSRWQEEKQNHPDAAPRDLYTQTTFPEIVELRSEELQSLHLKSPADKDRFWEQRHCEFLAATREDKDNQITAIESRLKCFIEALQSEITVLNMQVLADNLALNAEISDEEFLELMSINPGSREEWLTRRDDRIQALTSEEKLKVSHQTSTSLRRSVETSSSVRWPTVEEYALLAQSININLQDGQMALYEDYEGGSSTTLNFNSNEVWAEFAEHQHEQVNDEEDEEAILLQELYQKQLRDLAQRRRNEARARNAGV